MSSPPAPQFDRYAPDYDAALNQGLSVSGEDKHYFARGRLQWTAARVRRLGREPGRVLDFGCGTGSATPFLREAWPAAELHGVDVSTASLDVARRDHGAHAAFATLEAFQPRGDLDLVYCNGVFHHVPPAERLATVRLLLAALRPGGLLALWDNNGWNPAARYVMSRIPFDRDAVPLSPREGRQLVQAGGFHVVRTDHLFIFPRVLAALRPLERHVARWPLGTQFLVLARRPPA